MAEQTSVVTPERYGQGFTYPDYIAQINVNKDMFEKYTETAADSMTADDVAFFTKAASMEGGAARMMVIGEDWCPDVYRGMPVFNRVAESAGMELRVFPRDEHLDIMDEFLNRGEFRSIPTAVFYTKDGDYLCHWIERPAIGYAEGAPVHRGGPQGASRGRGRRRGPCDSPTPHASSATPHGSAPPSRRSAPMLAEKLGI